MELKIEHPRLDEYLVEEGKRRRPNILYIDEYKLIYCVIPKTGCTNWKKIMLFLTSKWDESVMEKIRDGHWDAARQGCKKITYISISISVLITKCLTLLFLKPSKLVEG